MNIYTKISFIELIVLFVITIATATITYVAISTGGYYEETWTFSSDLMVFSLNAFDITILYFLLYIFIYLFSVIYLDKFFGFPMSILLLAILIFLRLGDLSRDVFLVVHYGI
jgi:hypothetical protein